MTPTFAAGRCPIRPWTTEVCVYYATKTACALVALESVCVSNATAEVPRATAATGQKRDAISVTEPLSAIGASGKTNVYAFVVTVSVCAFVAAGSPAFLRQQRDRRGQHQ